MVQEWVVAGSQPVTAVPHVSQIMHLVRADPPARPTALVLAGCGGGGATTTTLGIAAQMARRVAVVAVDGTHADGDLAIRGADHRYSALTMHNWLASATTPAGIGLASVLSQASSGVRLLSSDPAALPNRETLASVCQRLNTEGLATVVDGGSAVTARQLRPLLDQPQIRPILVIPARYDAANRVAVTLARLDTEFGEALIASTVLVVSHQTPNTPPVSDALAAHYRGWIHRVIDVPYDSHLAGGMTVTDAALAAPTRRAYREIVWATTTYHRHDRRTVDG
ncbi:MinD/ParA family protein [Nocardia asteroides]|uniref:MinD/ParA family protein n=1 Tax=Nocardia asteroides TaxID=1824 RepID=UPI0037C729FB